MYDFNGFNVKVGIDYIAVAIDVAAEKLAGYRFWFLLHHMAVLVSTTSSLIGHGWKFCFFGSEPKIHSFFGSQNA